MYGKGEVFYDFSFSVLSIQMVTLFSEGFLIESTRYIQGEYFTLLFTPTPRTPLVFVENLCKEA